MAATPRNNRPNFSFAAESNRHRRCVDGHGRGAGGLEQRQEKTRALKQAMMQAGILHREDKIAVILRMR